MSALVHLPPPSPLLTYPHLCVSVSFTHIHKWQSFIALLLWGTTNGPSKPALWRKELRREFGFAYQNCRRARCEFLMRCPSSSFLYVQVIWYVGRGHFGRYEQMWMTKKGEQKQQDSGGKGFDRALGQHGAPTEGLCCSYFLSGLSCSCGRGQWICQPRLKWNRFLAGHIDS